MEFTGERYLPGRDNVDEISIYHLQRYLSVQKNCQGKKVLDIACGEGYGSNILADMAQYVEGVDISEEAVAHARDTYHRDNLKFAVGSVSQIPAEDGSFDVVVSFETIEHVDEETQFQFLKEVKRVLRKNGFLIISSPDKKNYSDIPCFKNAFHIHELYRNEFEVILKRFFSYVKLYDQTMYCNSVIGDNKGDLLSQCRTISLGFSEFESRAEYSIAICSDVNGMKIESTVVLDQANLYYRMKDLISALKGSIGAPEVIIEQKENYIQDQRQLLSSRDNEIRELKGIIEQKENYIQEQRQLQSERDDAIRELKGIIEQKENYIQEQRQLQSERDDTIRELKGIIEQKENYIQEQRQLQSERDDAIRELKDIIEQKENYIQEQRQQLEEQNRQIEERDIQIKEQSRYIQTLERFLLKFPVSLVYKLYVKWKRMSGHGTDV